MQVAVFSSKPHDRLFLDAANEAAGSWHDIRYFEVHLGLTTVGLAQGRRQFVRSSTIKSIETSSCDCQISGFG